jgi:hypothetical protein
MYLRVATTLAVCLVTGCGAAPRTSTPPPPPPNAEQVADHLAFVAPEIFQCGILVHAYDPGGVDVSVVMSDRGRWSATVRPTTLTPVLSDHDDLAWWAFGVCVRSALHERIGPVTHVEGPEPRVVSRHFSLDATEVTATSEPPIEGRLTMVFVSRLAQLLATRRAQVGACLPQGIGVVRPVSFMLELGPDGSLRVLGLRPHEDDVAVTRCVQEAIADLRGPTSPRIMRGEVHETALVYPRESDVP